MERNILAVGDVVAPAGVKYCKAALPRCAGSCRSISAL